MLVFGLLKFTNLLTTVHYPPFVLFVKITDLPLLADKNSIFFILNAPEIVDLRINNS